MLKCICGGKFISSDFPRDSGLRNYGHIVYDTVRINPGFATRTCDKCGKIRKQKLRTKKERVNE